MKQKQQYICSIKHSCHGSNNDTMIKSNVAGDCLVMAMAILVETAIVLATVRAVKVKLIRVLEMVKVVICVMEIEMVKVRRLSW